MPTQPSSFVLDQPRPLSRRAQRFLVRTALIDPAPGRDAVVSRTYGDDGPILDTLRRARARYGGLRYHSGFFGTMVTFAPRLLIRDPGGEPLAIDAARTTGAAGATLTADGPVEVGSDLRVAEFASLDGLVESDSQFWLAGRHPVTTRMQLDADGTDDVSVVASLFGLDPVPEASGRHTTWLTGATCDVFWSRLGPALGGARSTYVRAWCGDDDIAADLRAALVRAYRP